jgi:hypothetical protein
LAEFSRRARGRYPRHVLMVRAMLDSWKFDRILVPLVARPFT